MRHTPFQGRSGQELGAAAALHSVSAALGKVAHQYGEWRRRAQGRRQLMALGEAGLKDLGLGRSEAFHEYSKPFWRG